jgi:hypothetical protein
MSSGFTDEATLKDRVGPLLLPPDKVLPPIAATRGQSSQSHRRNLNTEPSLEPAELASISTLDMDDSFWWVWITSLSGDEPGARKAVFGRCALLETRIRDTKWLVLEEQIKGAAPEPDAGAQIVEKKRFFSFGSRKGASKLSRSKSSAKKISSSIEESYQRPNNLAQQSKTSIGPDQHKRIQAAAAALQKKHREQEAEANQARNGPGDDTRSTKTNSVMTLQPAIVNEASSAMKWASNYDKNAFRTAYLSNSRAGTGAVSEGANGESNGTHVERPITPPAPLPTSTAKNGPAPPPKDTGALVTPLPPSPEPAQQEPAKEPVDDEKKKGVAKTVVIEDPAESQPKQSIDESGKKLKKKTGNAGFKNMFGGKKKTEQPQPPMKSTGAKETSAVAAARAALEAKAKESQDPVARSSPAKPIAIKKKPIPAAAAEATPAPVPAAAPEPEAEPEKPSTPQQNPEPAHEEPRAPSQVIQGSGSPPKTRRAVEYDALSRVDTNEANAADQEFSKFDQGPLVDQPAFVPEDSPVEETQPKEDVLPKSPTNGNGHSHDVKPEVATEPQSGRFTSTEDRWAQIRKNAAERREATSATSDEPEVRTSQSERTDEGDTSGEETIESRVARIRARVAELTGNMEGAR